MVYYDKEASHFINGPLSHASSFLTKKRKKMNMEKIIKSK